MDLTFDLANNTLKSSPDAEISLKWRSREPVRIQFTRNGTVELLTAGYGLALYVAKAGDLLAQVTGWSTPGTTAGWYEGSLVLHTAALTSAFEEATVTQISAEVELHQWAAGQASTPAISDNDVLAHIHRPAIEPEPASEEVLTGGEEWLEARAPRYYPAITGLTGGGSTKLDGLTTAGKTALLATIYVASTLQDWMLLAGTDAEDTAADIVRPDDYNASTNAQVWKRLR